MSPYSIRQVVKAKKRTPHYVRTAAAALSLVAVAILAVAGIGAGNPTSLGKSRTLHAHRHRSHFFAFGDPTAGSGSGTPICRHRFFFSSQSWRALLRLIAAARARLSSSLNAFSPASFSSAMSEY